MDTCPQYFDFHNLPSEQTLTATYEEHGYLVINNVFDDDETERYKKEIDRCLLKEDTNDSEEWSLHHLEAAYKSMLIRKLASDHRIVKLLTLILGEDIELQHSKFAVKNPKAAHGNVIWHQDFAFFPHTNANLAAVAIAVTDITEENGAMEALVKGHRLGLLNHWDKDTFNGGCSPNEIKELIKHYGTTYITPNKGGISIHNALLPHCSHINKTAKPRHMVVFEYRASNAYQLADATWRDTGIQVSGAYRGEVKFDPSYLNTPTLRLPRSDRYPKHPYGSVYNQKGMCTNEAD